jgi:hypothetical protein
LNGADEGRAVVMQPDGRIIVAGQTWKGGDSGSRDLLVLRLFSSPTFIRVAPSTNPFDFGSVIVADGKHQSFTGTNEVDINLAIGQLAISGANRGDFILQNDACTNKTIAPGAKCSFDVVFTPGVPTSRKATLSIPSSRTMVQNNLIVWLQGMGFFRQGDLNRDRQVDLRDVIIALRIVSGLETDLPFSAGSSINAGDVDRDNTLGLPEALYILQWVGGIR